MLDIELKQIAIVGCGVMGAGIALEFARGGYEVMLYGRRPAGLQVAIETIAGNLQLLTQAGLLTGEEARTTLPHIQTTTSLEEALLGADFALEAVVEDLDVKRDILARMDEYCHDDAIMASTTAGLQPSYLAAATRRGDQFLVTHFFNPPYLVPVVEMVPCPRTIKMVIEKVEALLKKIGKSPAILEQETPGFIAHRLQVVMLREALLLVQLGIASPAAIDTVVKGIMGRQFSAAGLFELFELAGWDVMAQDIDDILSDLENTRQLSPLVTERLDRGELGAKTGQGFYTWTPEKVAALRQKIIQALVEMEGWSR